jgi:hypothetical protein
MTDAHHLILRFRRNHPVHPIGPIPPRPNAAMPEQVRKNPNHRTTAG